MITRRIFVGAMAGVCLPREHLVLEAIAAERMPHRMIVTGIARSPFFELRDYGTSSPRLNPLRPVLIENGKLLFSFDSLAARERAWREIGASEDGSGLREIAVYRCLETLSPARSATSRFHSPQF